MDNINNKIIKTIIISLILLVVVILIIIVILKKDINDNNIENGYQEDANIPQDDFEVIDNNAIIDGEKVTKVSVISEYFNIKYCIEEYFQSIIGMRHMEETTSRVSDEDIDSEDQEKYKNEYYLENKTILYNILYNKYNEENNITINNIEEKFPDIKNSKVLIEEALKYQITYNVSVYWIKGELISYEDYNKSEFKIMILLNIEDKPHFEIIPWEYAEKIGFNTIKENETIDISKINYNFEINDYNTFEYQNKMNSDIIQEYYNNTMFCISFNQEFLYRKLNQEYSNKKFKDIDDFKKYINNNKNNYLNGFCNKYKMSIEDEYIRYVCLDSSGKYYIFNARTILDYDIILDTYTIDIPEFIEKYDKGNDTIKVGLNANKILEAANDKDYNYIYEKLDETFRDNNFSEGKKFIEYINNQFYDNSVIQDTNIKQEGNTFICTMQITNKEKTEKLKEVTIIMKLLENRDFVISFVI